MMIFSLVVMTGLEKCCNTSAYLHWLCHSGEPPVARGPLVFLIIFGFFVENDCLRLTFEELQALQAKGLIFLIIFGFFVENHLLLTQNPVSMTYSLNLQFESYNLCWQQASFSSLFSDSLLKLANKKSSFHDLQFESYNQTLRATGLIFLITLYFQFLC